MKIEIIKDHPRYPLTEIQAAIFELIVDGFSVKQVGVQLERDPYNVGVHLYRLRRRFRANTNAELVLRAIIYKVVIIN